MTQTIEQAVQQQFGSAAAAYATSTVHQAGRDLTTMLEAAAPQPTWRVLDAGCGAGHTGLAFAPQVAQVVACDLTPQMLDQVARLAAERGLTNVVTQQADVKTLPFEDAAFDLVVSRYSAHHWPQPQDAVQELVRVLKPGGAFILSDIVASEAFAEDTFLQTLELLRDPSHVRDYRLSEWQGFLAGAGLACETLLTFALPLHFGQWLARINTPPVHAAAIRALFTGAPQAMKQTYHLPDAIETDEFEFTIYGAVLRGVKPARA